MTPQLLRLSLLDALGPRAGLARKKRVKLLMPSYSLGHPILRDPREWAPNRMAPIHFWMTAPADKLCGTMGLDAGELAHYQLAWKMTTGDKWRRLVLSPTADGGGAEGAAGAGAQLVKIPHGRLGDVRAFGGGSSFYALD